MDTVIPKDNGENITGAFFTFENGGKIWVQDAKKIQNSKLFEEGLNLINTKVNPSRAEYLKRLVGYFSRQSDDKITTEPYCHFVALICDIACHKDKKLCMPSCYDKIFNKYVANVFYNYYLDDSFTIWKLMEVVPNDMLPMPEIFKCA